MKMEKIDFSETSAYKIQTAENYPEENIQHTEHGEILKSRINQVTFHFVEEGPGRASEDNKKECNFNYSNKQTDRCNL
jgi:hypothetical protein